MAKTVGIPRALYYHYYYPLWQKYLSNLGFQTIVSSPTSKQTIDWGVSLAVEGTCLPVKVYYGHVCELVEKGVDYLFIPQIISVSKREYICPKFMGLPDMVKASISKQVKLLSPTIDGRKSERQITKTYIQFGLQFAPWHKVLRAYGEATKVQREYEERLKRECSLEKDMARLTVGVLGHSYLLYDKTISMNLLERLTAAKIRVVTPEQFKPNLVNEHANRLPKRMFWTSGRKILGTLNYLLDRRNVEQIDGVISLAAFGCGTDSLTSELVAQIARKQNLPYLLLNLDEHTGEAGLVTRIEAYLDMLERRKYA